MKVPLNEELLAMLKEAIEEMGLTLQELAYKTDLSLPTINRTFREKKATPFTWLQIAGVLQLDEEIKDALYDLTTVGGRLQYMRHSLGMNRSEMAKDFDTHVTTIAKWESGNRLPSREQLVELSNYFGCSTDYILKGEEF